MYARCAYETCGKATNLDMRLLCININDKLPIAVSRVPYFYKSECTERYREAEHFMPGLYMLIVNICTSRNV